MQESAGPTSFGTPVDDPAGKDPGPEVDPSNEGVLRTETLDDRIRAAARDRGSLPALYWHDQAISWTELDARVDAVANALRRASVPGAGPPARVAIALPNTPDFVIAFFATLRAGLVAVPVNPAFTAREVRHVLADSSAGMLLCTEPVRHAVENVRDTLPTLRAVHTELPQDAATPQPPRAATDGGDLAALLYTSGTAGAPKGAMLSHRALLANHEQIGRIEPGVVGPDDVVLLAVPLFHAYGLNAGLGAVAYHGACGVLVERFDAAETLGAVARHRVTTLMGVPSMYVAWSRRPELRSAARSVRMAVCGAAPLHADAARRFTAVTGRQIHVGYGLTETAPVLTSTLLSPESKPGSIGRPIPGVELRLIGTSGDEVGRESEHEDELEVALGSPGTDPGEIVVRGRNLFSGYWPDGRHRPDADGWWATGDIGYADGDGDLFLVDRVDELILVNGFNVYPHEVELVLDAHPDVAESAVVGAAHPETGQTVKAYVVPVAGSTVGVDDLLRHCAGNLARFKCPTSVEFVEVLPRSTIGKVRKAALVRGGAESPMTAQAETAARAETVTQAETAVRAETAARARDGAAGA